MPVLSQLRNGIFLDRKSETALAKEAVRKYSIRTPSVEMQVMQLSGGNQQKTILGRWTSEKIETKILILDEPTKGIDVGTKAEVYQMVCDFAKQDRRYIHLVRLTEVLNVSDNIIVMHNGHITGRVSGQRLRRERP